MELFNAALKGFNYPHLPPETSNPRKSGKKSTVADVPKDEAVTPKSNSEPRPTTTVSHIIVAEAPNNPKDMEDFLQFQSFDFLYHDVIRQFQEVKSEMSINHETKKLRGIIGRFLGIRLLFDDEIAFIRNVCFKV